MLHVHRAAGAATLVEALAALLAEPSGDVFAPEVVAVPARGVERWITQRLSHVLGAHDLRTGAPGSPGRPGAGVCANVVFPSPGALLDEALAAVSPLPGGGEDPWAPERAVWPLLEVIDACAGEAWCARLTAHLEPGGRRYAVAARLAGLFDAYGRERPELVRGWAGDLTVHQVPSDLDWQPELWRRLRVRIGVPSPAERLPGALVALRTDPAAVALPARVSVFGATRISAARLAVLAALAEHREVHLWLQHASPALWAAVAGGRPPAHPLLASMASDVTALQRRLAAAAPGHADVRHAGPVPPGTLLGRLQADLAADRVPPLEERELLDPADRSVAVHACHGRARQVEVLREALLGLLAADPTLEPRDVLVMCPDIEEFAPLVAAAFGLETGYGPAHPAGRLRVRLADRALRQANPLLGTLANLLDLATGRVTASAVLDLAASAPVRRRFRFDDDELARLREWVGDAGIRWGLDAAHRARFCLDTVAQGTWRDGLDRLLLGVAMPGGEHWLGSAVPVGDVDSAGIDLAGRFAEFVDRLAAGLEGLAGEREVAAWADHLVTAVLAIAEPAPGAAWQAAALGGELADIRAAAEGCPGVRISPPDLAVLLRGRLAGRPTRASFRTGTLTVATMVPMRSVPHRVVALLGLDEATFPRSPVPDGDDLLARDPRPGERNARTEDRQLLLDAVCAAQEHLLVVYSGADERTGAPVPPAVPVGELLDALDATARTASGRRVRDELTVRHPLQPFDPRAFEPRPAGAGPSFDRASLAGARALVGPRTPAPPLAGEPLPPAEGDPDAEVDVDSLARLFEHPARGFLRQRLGIAPAGEDPEPADALPLDLDGLEKWAVGERILRARLRGVDVATCLGAEARRGMLPPGVLGHRVAVRIGQTADEIVRLARLPVPGLKPDEPAGEDSVDVDVVLGAGRRVSGTVACGGPPGLLLRVSYSSLGAKHRLRAWVELLAVTVADPDRQWRAAVVGRWSGGARRSVLGPVPEEVARTVLADLVALRALALCEPLPLPVRGAEAYANRRRRGMPADKALAAAEQEWQGGRMPEQDEPAHVLLYGPAAPFEVVGSAVTQPADVGPDTASPSLRVGRHDTASEPTRLGTLALRLWTPLLAHEEQDR